MKPIRIGQIGVGHEHASGLWRRCDASRCFEVVGVVEEEDIAVAFAPPRASRRCLRRALARGLEAVAVGTNMPEAVATATRCMERGLHMHLDKPGGEALQPFGTYRRLQGRSLAINWATCGPTPRSSSASGRCERMARRHLQVDAVMAATIVMPTARSGRLPWWRDIHFGPG